MSETNLDDDAPGQQQRQPPPLPPPILNYAAPQIPAGSGQSGQFAAGFLLAFAAIIMAAISGVMVGSAVSVAVGWATFVAIPGAALAFGIRHLLKHGGRVMTGMLCGMLMFVVTVALAFGICVTILR